MVRFGKYSEVRPTGFARERMHAAVRERALKGVWLERLEESPLTAMGRLSETGFGGKGTKNSALDKLRLPSRCPDRDREKAVGNGVLRWRTTFGSHHARTVHQKRRDW